MRIKKILFSLIVIIALIFSINIKPKADTQVSDLTGTTWLFNDTIDITFFDTTSIINLNFNSNTNLEAFYTSISVDGTDLLYSDDKIAYSAGSWNVEYKTIKITGGGDVLDADVISWLYSNAQLIGTTVDINGQYEFENYLINSYDNAAFEIKFPTSNEFISFEITFDVGSNGEKFMNAIFTLEKSASNELTLVHVYSMAYDGYDIQGPLSNQVYIDLIPKYFKYSDDYSYIVLDFGHVYDFYYNLGIDQINITEISSSETVLSGLSKYSHSDNSTFSAIYYDIGYGSDVLGNEFGKLKNGLEYDSLYNSYINGHFPVNVGSGFIKSISEESIVFPLGRYYLYNSLLYDTNVGFESRSDILDFATEFHRVCIYLELTEFNPIVNFFTVLFGDEDLFSYRNDYVFSSFPLEIDLISGPELEGFEFSHYAVKSDSGYEEISEYSIDCDVLEHNIYLIYDFVGFDVTFDLNNGEDDVVVKHEAGQPIQYPSTPKKNGYYFVEWLLFDQNNNTYTSITSNYRCPGTAITIVAKYLPITCTIVFNANNGTSASFNVVLQYGVYTTVPTSSYEKEGYIFKGWNSKSDGTGTWSYPGEKISIDGNFNIIKEGSTLSILEINSSKKMLKKNIILSEVESEQLASSTGSLYSIYETEESSEDGDVVITPGDSNTTSNESFVDDLFAFDEFKDFLIIFVLLFCFVVLINEIKSRRR